MAQGKTSLLYRMVLGKAIQVIPTIGFNVDTFSLNGVKFTAWDVGGRGKVSNGYYDILGQYLIFRILFDRFVPFTTTITQV
jgi:GTPase SAR1 family protein